MNDRDPGTIPDFAIIGSGVFPSALGISASLTIMAMGRKAARTILSKE